MRLALKLTVAACIAVLPSWLKILWYRTVRGYRIGRGVRIGFGSALVGVQHCSIGDGVRIGPLNVFYQVDELVIGERASIGYLNLIRGGGRVELGPYASILRLNVLNSILDPDVVTPFDASLQIGAGAVVTTGHWLDFSDRISIGDHVIIGGRGSSFWTHSRQRTRPITIGDQCYLGSEVRVAPGVEVAPSCIVSLGAVLMGRYEPERSLIMGNPARVERPLRERDLFLVTRKTRNDLPDELLSPSS